MPKGMGYGNGNGKHAKKKGGDSVSFAPVGNVKIGAYGTVKEGKSLDAYNCGTKGAPGKVAGSHRKTYSVGTVRGSHRRS